MRLLSFLIVSISLSLSASLAWAAKESAYYELDPAFVVNYGDPEGRLKYLKVDVALRLKSPEDKDKIDDYLPMVRHIMVMKLSSLEEERVLQPTAQEEIRQESLEEIKQFFVDEKLPAYVSDLLFNVFLVQN